MTENPKRKILIDFDGVINDYKGKYKENSTLQIANFQVWYNK